MTIDAYLLELERLLPRAARLRALAEVREHLRDRVAAERAAGLTPVDAEVAATQAFGPVEDVARRLAAELAVRESRLSAALALAATLLFVFPLYVVPENTLPPAPWAEKPSDIALLQSVAIACWMGACLLAGVATLVAWTRSSRLAAPLLIGSAVAVTLSTGVSIALAVRWFALTPATPSWALAAPLAATCVALCAGAAVWGQSSSRRLVAN
ncbi:MAG: permease prefix domain 1-containing protein [Gaiellaceae bacterium]